MTIKITGNTAPLSATLGHFSGIVKTISTERYIGSAIDYAHGQLAPKFDTYMDLVAAASPSNYHHVYEWSRRFGDRSNVGNPAMRLWRHTLTGRGSNKVASFRFLQSKRASPVNPILTNPGPTGRKVKTGVHIFYWKASAMEYGLEITVKPTVAKMLAFVADKGQRAQNDNRMNSQNITFSDGPINFTAGGGKTTGRFSTAYMQWWSVAANKVFDEQIKPELEADANSASDLRKTIRKYKQLSIRATNQANTKAFKEAQAAAVKHAMEDSTDYTAKAMARRRRMYGDV